LCKLDDCAKETVERGRSAASFTLVADPGPGRGSVFTVGTGEESAGDRLEAFGKCLLFGKERDGRLNGACVRDGKQEHEDREKENVTKRMHCVHVFEVEVWLGFCAGGGDWMEEKRMEIVEGGARRESFICSWFVTYRILA
jgi:hypothetical protein